jgi:mannose-6-phosphate isomerase-like protein (cupin superfamily)
MNLATKQLPSARDDVAPDGSDVRLLLGLERGGMAHFEIGPNEVSTAVSHRTVEEIWYFVSGRGEMWRRQGDREEVVPVYPGVSLTIPLGTHFQFRSCGYEPLAAIGNRPCPARGERRTREPARRRGQVRDYRETPTISKIVPSASWVWR